MTVLRYYCPGTVKLVQVPGEGVLMADGHERFEDGTPNFLSSARFCWESSSATNL